MTKDIHQGLPAAIDDIIQRTLAWIEQDSRRLPGDSRSTQITRDGSKTNPQEPAQLSHMSAALPNPLLTESSSRNVVSFAVPTRSSFYPDPSVAGSSVYGGPMDFPGASIQAPNESQYNPADHHFPYGGGHMRMEPQQGHGHDPGPSQRSGSTVASYGPGAPAGMAQGSQSVIWRSQMPTNQPHDIGVDMAGPGGSGASTWNDWNTAVPGGQDSRYGPQHTLLGMGQPPRQHARPTSGMQAGSNMEMAIDPGVSVTSDDLTWPGMMYHGSSERQQRSPH